MVIVDNLADPQPQYIWGDNEGGYFGQSFIAEGSTLDELQFITNGQWLDEPTDYKVIITTFVNDRPGEIIGSSDLYAVDRPGLQTVSFNSVALTPGTTYALLLDTTYGTSTQGRGAVGVETGAAADYAGGYFFINTAEIYEGSSLYGTHDLSFIYPYPSQDLNFKLVFDSVTQTLTANGTNAAETFTATTNDNYVYNGLGGHDLIVTQGGNDSLGGGNGNDTISSGSGNDSFYYSGVGQGFDAIDGGAGNDRIYATANGTVIGLTSLVGIEAILANGFSNVAIAGSGYADTLDLSAVNVIGITRFDLAGGNDTFIAPNRDNTIIGGGGDDLLVGGSGYDLFLFSGNSGRDTIDGGGGFGYDTIRATADNSVLNWGQVTDVEFISGGGYANVRIVGTGGDDIIDLGRDRTDFNNDPFNLGVITDGIAAIEGGAGNDTIYGPSSAATIMGGNGNDVLVSGGGHALFGGSGSDLFRVTSGGESSLTIDGGAGYDVVRADTLGVILKWANISGVEEISSDGRPGMKVVGSDGADQIVLSDVRLIGVSVDGLNGDDTIVGSDRPDVIAGGGGADLLTGGVGADVLTGGAGSDLFRYLSVTDSSATSGIDTISDFVGGSDKIDLRYMAASRLYARPDTFIGTAEFHDDRQGEVRYETVGGNTYISMNLSGDKTPEIEIILTGTHALTSGDFLFPR